MRRLILVAGLLLSTTAFAAEPVLKGSGGYGAAGCGLGSMLFNQQPGVYQILASTTNGTFASQTFGITTGTSNCGSGMMASGTRNFVEANRDALAKDMSRGQGETIGALTWMAGCGNSQAVGAALQQRYSTIIPSEKASSQEIADKLLETLKADKSLGCQI
jgi:basic membrane lipoprotein Med (substrate-binding protein (PBP1-ABC) superfamily)